MVHSLKKQGPPPWGRKIEGWRRLDIIGFADYLLYGPRGIVALTIVFRRRRLSRLHRARALK
jgi:hypothetical protein